MLNSRATNTGFVQKTGEKIVCPSVHTINQWRSIQQPRSPHFEDAILTSLEGHLRNRCSFEFKVSNAIELLAVGTIYRYEMHRVLHWLQSEKYGAHHSNEAEYYVTTS